MGTCIPNTGTCTPDPNAYKSIDENASDMQQKLNDASNATTSNQNEITETHNEPVTTLFDEHNLSLSCISLSPNDWNYYEYLLLYGYLRAYAVYTIGHDTIMLIFKYFDESYIFSIKKNSQLLSKPINVNSPYVIPLHRQCIDDKINTIFYIPSDRKSIKFELKVPTYKLSGDQKMMVYVGLSCDKLQCYAKGVTQFNARTRKLLPVQVCSMKNWMRLKENEIVKFKVNIKVIDACNITSIFIPRINLSEIVEYEWNIDNKLLEMFQNADVNTSFYSNNFDENGTWCLEFIPCTKDGECIVGLGLIKLPLNMHSIKVHVTLYVNGKKTWGIFGNEQITFDHQYKWSHSSDGREPPTSVMLNSELFMLRQLRFNLKITVQSFFAYDEEGKRIAIPAYHWKRR